MAIGQVAPQAYTRDTLAQAYAWVQNQPDSIKKMATSPDFLVGLYLRYQRHGDSTPSTFKTDLKNLANELKAPEIKPREELAEQEDIPQAPPSRAKISAAALASAQWNSPSPRASQWAYPPQSDVRPSAQAQVQPAAHPKPVPGELFQQVQQPQVHYYEPPRHQAPPPVEPPAPQTYFEPERHPPFDPQTYHPRQHFTEPPVAPRMTPPPATPVAQKKLEDFLDIRTMKMVEDIKSLLNLGSEEEAIRALVAQGYERMRILFNHR